MGLRILCMGAHPDDVELGMGGTVASLVRRKHEVLILDLTNGEPTPHGSPEIRARESKAAAKALGAPRKTLDMPNRYLEETIENRKKLAAEIRAFRPDYLFSPYPVDAHPDHIAAGQLAESSRFYAKLTKSDIPGEPHFPRRVIYYFPVHIRLRIEPSFVFDMSDTLEQKRKAILNYESQFKAGKKEHIIDSVLNENRYWGFQAGVEAAEPFFQREITLFRQWPEGYH
ncbi:MAG: PIG-L family deacetylase [Leptospiraceae bacterium]|nr:PIG-L family deacetylase [Leptospiraceae bacterium]